MEIIPVIDLQGGIVVHARRGDRARYQPLVTPFAARPDPLAVIDGLLAFQPFSTFYIADLDAIAGGAAQHAVINTLLARYPQALFWIDGGFAQRHHVAPYAARSGLDVVLGSESQISLAAYNDLCAVLPPSHTVLSLDRRGATPLGCAELFAASQLWPARIIHMNLERVGAGEGPDWHGLEQLRVAAPAAALYAAGGVRDDADLALLAARGIAGVLVATALHDGRVTCAQLTPVA